MPYSWRQRWDMFLCKILGHDIEAESTWEYNGSVHGTCERCCRVVSTPIYPKV